MVATDTLVAQLTPPRMRGRVFGAVFSAAQLGSSVATAAGGWLVAAAGRRGAFAVAAAGMLAGLALFRPAIRAARAPAWTPRTSPGRRIRGKRPRQ